MRIRWSLPVVLAILALVLALPAYAADASAPDSISILSLFGGGLALLVPLGLTLLIVGGFTPEHARTTTLTFLIAVSLAVLSYWAIGFALQFGGVGLVDARPGYSKLVWEWSLLGESWGPGWGMAGLSGFGLFDTAATPDAYLLFFSRLPWVITATLIPLLALRGRAPAPTAFVAGALTGGFLYPLAANWSTGGGWLANLGRTLGFGHGLADFGNVGPVFLIGAIISLVGMLFLVPRRTPRPFAEIPALPAVHLPLLSIIGAGLVLVGGLGWALSNPLADWVRVPPALVALNVAVAGAGGALLPFAYTWFVSGNSHALMSARGLAAGVIAGLAVAGFVPPWAALALGLLAGLLVPLVNFAIEEHFHLDDNTGSVSVFGIGSLVGLLGVAIFADGRYGQGWNRIGVETYLATKNQGVTGLFPASGFLADWPGQLLAQVIGIVAYALFSFVVSALVFAALAALINLWRQAQQNNASDVAISTDTSPVEQS